MITPPPSLDTSVADRQAFGALYARPGNLDEQVNRYSQGILKLAAHPGFDGDFTDWTADPFADSNWKAQHQTLRWLNPLRWAALDGDTAARVEWIRVVRSWFDTHVPISKAKASPGWGNMIDGNRAIQLSLGSSLVSPTSTWFVQLLEAHRDRLMDEANIVHKNHGMHQHAGLLVVGATLRDPSAMSTAVHRMRDQFLVTFDSEGADDEGAINYHQLNIIWWRELWERARLEGFEKPTVVEERLERACHVLAQFSLPDGQLPQIGDTVRGSVVADLSDVTDFVRSRGSEGVRPTGTSMVLERGYIVSRSGWGETRPIQNESHTLIRYGDDIRGHSHQDRGSVHLYADGVRWLVDGGFHSYQLRHPMRLHLQSRAAHNVASLKGIPHRDSAPVELVGNSVSEAAHDFTLLDHGYPGDNMRRRVLYLPGPNCWIICDTATPSVPTSVQQQWQVEPGVSVRSLDRGYRLSKSGASLTITWLGRDPLLRYVKAVDNRLAGWVGVKWKKQKPGALVTAESSTDSPQLVALIAPSTDHLLGIVSSKVTLSGLISVELVRGNHSWRVAASPDGASVNEAN